MIINVCYANALRTTTVNRVKYPHPPKQEKKKEKKNKKEKNIKKEKEEKVTKWTDCLLLEILPSLCSLSDWNGKQKQWLSESRMYLGRLKKLLISKF